MTETRVYKPFFLRFQTLPGNSEIRQEQNTNKNKQTKKKKTTTLKFKVNVSIATRVATKKERYITKITDKELALIRNLQSNMNFHNRYTSLKHS